MAAIMRKIDNVNYLELLDVLYSTVLTFKDFLVAL